MALEIVTESQLRACVLLQEVDNPDAPGPRRPLGIILMESGYMNSDEFVAVIVEQHRRMGKPVRHSLLSRRDLLFGQIAVRQEFITKEQLNQTLWKQARMVEEGHPSRRLGLILLDMGWIDPPQIRKVLLIQNKRILVCRACGHRFNAVGAVDGRLYSCSKCSGKAEPQFNLEDLDTGDTIDVSKPSSRS